MTDHPNLFEGKTVLMINGGSAVGNWLLDHGAMVIVVPTALIRSLQGHARAISADGADYERYKSRISWITKKGGTHDAADMVVATGHTHPLVREARQRGIPIVSPRQVARIRNIPSPQRTLTPSETLTVVDDSGAWVPERGVTSLMQWGSPNCILIAGGNGRSDYAVWAREVRQRIRPTNFILLTGTALPRMRKALGAWGRGIRAYDSLEDALAAAHARAKLHITATILFSPAAKVAQNFRDLVRLK